MDLCFQSLVKSLLFFFSVFSFSFFLLWKDSLTNYDSWVEGLSLFTLQRQTRERQGARHPIDASTVRWIFSLSVVFHFWLCDSICAFIRVVKSFQLVLKLSYESIGMELTKSRFKSSCSSLKSDMIHFSRHSLIIYLCLLWPSCLGSFIIMYYRQTTVNMFLLSSFLLSWDETSIS